MSVYNTNEYEEERKPRPSAFLGFIAIAFIGLVIFLSLAACITSVSPGYNGVVFNRFGGGIQEKTLGQGWHVLFPWETVMKYPVSTETVYFSKAAHEGRKTDDSIWVNTADGKSINVDVTFAYHFDPLKLPTLYSKFKGAELDTIEYGFLKNEILQVVNNVTSSYPVMALIGDKRTEINGKIFTSLKELFEANGIILENINLSRVEPDPATVAAIQNVVNAQNALLQSKVEKDRADVEAKTAVIKAQGIADSAYINADGQARANAKLREILTAEQIIEQQRIAKWNGAYPTTLTVLGASTPTFFGMK